MATSSLIQYHRSCWYTQFRGHHGMTLDRLIAEGAETSRVEGDFLHSMATSDSSMLPQDSLTAHFPFGS